MKVDPRVCLEKAHATIARSDPDLPHDILIQKLRVGTRLRAESIDGELPIGASRFGGLPDLPVDVAWPRWEGFLEETVLHTGKVFKHPYPPVSLTFLAQLDLREIPDARGVLPEAGWLYFFYDAGEQPWGFDPRHRGSASVLFVEGGGALSRRSPPADVSLNCGSFEPRRVQADLVATLPRWPSELGLTIEDETVRDAYEELAETDIAGGGPHHRLLGWPKLVQGEMEMECQLAVNGIYCGTSDAFRTSKAKRLEADASDWIMLLQLDTDDGDSGPGWMWGDSGCIYFWIRKQDLAARRFDRGWTILQCY
jgi:uncharacterized protein YwqG